MAHAMTYRSQAPVGSSAGWAPGSTDVGQQIARLCHVLKLVEKIAGRTPWPRDDTTLDDHARISNAYGHAPPIVQRRFDALAGETAAWVATGVEALLAAGDEPARAAAEQLARELDRAIAGLSKMLGVKREPRSL
ncbi:MAG: hypothetical protein JWN69_772 [Alphaproteobacteria bacterium]|nr:hypothetical protein [Alphaproteobacteria bacterium]